MSPVLLFVLFFVILLFAFPISVTMGITSILPWLVDHSFAANLIVVLRQMMSGVNSLPLLAIPMFMLSGTIMAKGGISKKLFDVFTYFVGNVIGGIPCAVIITCLFYGAISGSAPATVAAVGAMTILSSVMQFAMLPLQGIAQGAQPISSYNYGAGNAQRVRQTFWLLLKVSLGYALVLWGCIQLFPGVFARIFTPDAELVAFTAGVLRIYCGALFLMGIQIACQMTFVSIGNAPCSIIVAVLRKFVLLLPLIYLLPHLLADQTRAVFLAEPVADVIAVTGTVILFSSQFRKALRGLEIDNKS